LILLPGTEIMHHGNMILGISPL